MWEAGYSSSAKNRNALIPRPFSRPHAEFGKCGPCGSVPTDEQSHPNCAFSVSPKTCWDRNVSADTQEIPAAPTKIIPSVFGPHATAIIDEVSSMIAEFLQQTVQLLQRLDQAEIAKVRDICSTVIAGEDAFSRPATAVRPRQPSISPAIWASTLFPRAGSLLTCGALPTTSPYTRPGPTMPPAMTSSSTKCGAYCSAAMF